MITDTHAVADQAARDADALEDLADELELATAGEDDALVRLHALVTDLHLLNDLLDTPPDLSRRTLYNALHTDSGAIDIGRVTTCLRALMDGSASLMQVLARMNSERAHVRSAQRGREVGGRVRDYGKRQTAKREAPTAQVQPGLPPAHADHSQERALPAGQQDAAQEAAQEAFRHGDTAQIMTRVGDEENMVVPDDVIDLARTDVPKVEGMSPEQAHQAAAESIAHANGDKRRPAKAARS